MSDEDLLIDVNESDPERRVPMFTITSAVYLMDETFDGEQSDLDFKFQATTPKSPNIMDWMTFLFLTKMKLDDLYKAALSEAVKAYLELREDVTEDVAYADLENYLAGRVSTSFEGENVLGLRDVEDDD